MNILLFLLVVCAPGLIKYEVGSGYEYGQEYGQVIVNEPAVWYQVYPPYQPTGICVKAGNEVFYFESDFNPNTWINTSGYAVSHVVVYGGAPTAVAISSFGAATQMPWYYALIPVAILLFVARMLVRAKSGNAAYRKPS